VRHIQRIVGLGVGVLAACALGSTPALASGSPSCTYDSGTRQVTVTHDTAGTPLTVKVDPISPRAGTARSTSPTARTTLGAPASPTRTGS
jgi:hypothetical protein